MHRRPFATFGPRTSAEPAAKPAGPGQGNVILVRPKAVLAKLVVNDVSGCLGESSLSRVSETVPASPEVGLGSSAAAVATHSRPGMVEAASGFVWNGYPADPAILRSIIAQHMTAAAAAGGAPNVSSSFFSFPLFLSIRPLEKFSVNPSHTSCPWQYPISYASDEPNLHAQSFFPIREQGWRHVAPIHPPLHRPTHSRHTRRESLSVNWSTSCTSTVVRKSYRRTFPGCLTF